MRNLSHLNRSTNYCGAIWPAYSVSRFSHMENTVRKRKTENTLAASTFNADVFKDCPLQHKLMKIKHCIFSFSTTVKRKRQTVISSQAWLQKNTCTIPLLTPLHTCVLLQPAPHPCAAQQVAAAQAVGPLTAAERTELLDNPIILPALLTMNTASHNRSNLKITSLSSPSVLRNSVTPLTSFEFINNASPYLHGQKEDAQRITARARSTESEKVIFSKQGRRHRTDLGDQRNSTGTGYWYFRIKT